MGGRGRPRIYDAERLERGIRKYFDSISREVAVTEAVDSGEKDEFGHAIYVNVPVKNKKGQEVLRTEFLVPPRIRELCRALKISESTWENYCDGEKHPELREITGEARAVIREWAEMELLTRPGKNVRGVLSYLEQHYYRQERENGGTESRESGVILIPESEED